MGHEHVYVFVSAWVCIYRYALRLGVRCGVFCKLSTLLLKTQREYVAMLLLVISLKCLSMIFEALLWSNMLPGKEFLSGCIDKGNTSFLISQYLLLISLLQLI